MKPGDMVVLRWSDQGVKFKPRLSTTEFLCDVPPITPRDFRANALALRPNEIAMVLESSTGTSELYLRILTPGGIGWIRSQQVRLA